MPGLLDYIATDPSQRAITAIGAGLLGVRRGQEGQAILGGLNAYDQALANQHRARVTDAQMQEQSLRMQQLQQQIADQEAARRFYGDRSQLMHPGTPAVVGNMDTAEAASPSTPRSSRDLAQRLMASGNPVLVQQGYAMLTKQDEPIKVGKDDRLLARDGNGGFRTLLDAAPDETRTTELAKLIGERDKFPPGHPIRAIYDNQIRKISTHAPATNVTVGLQAPYAGQDSQGNPIVVQPANRPGVAPQVLTGPDGKPIQPLANKKADLSEAQAKATTLLGQMVSASKELEKAGGDQAGAIEQFNVMASGTPIRALASERGGRRRQAQDQWAEAFLRFKTGAATTEAEIARNVATFFPQIGNGPEVIAQKRRARKQAENDMRIAAGRGTTQIDARTDASADGQAATMRFNPATGKLERVQQ